jgi:hypothetical protein
MDRPGLHSEALEPSFVLLYYGLNSRGSSTVCPPPQVKPITLLRCETDHTIGPPLKPGAGAAGDTTERAVQLPSWIVQGKREALGRLLTSPAWTLAPASWSRVTTSWAPFCRATTRGVRPHLSRASSGAPALMRISAAAVWPAEQARWRGVSSQRVVAAAVMSETRSVTCGYGSEVGPGSACWLTGVKAPVEQPLKTAGRVHEGRSV